MEQIPSPKYIAYNNLIYRHARTHINTKNNMNNKNTTPPVAAHLAPTIASLPTISGEGDTATATPTPADLA